MMIEVFVEAVKAEKLMGKGTGKNRAKAEKPRHAREDSFLPAVGFLSGNAATDDPRRRLSPSPIRRRRGCLSPPALNWGCTHPSNRN